MRKVTWLAAVALLLASVAVPVSGFGQQGADPADQYYDCIRQNELRMLNAMVNTKGVKNQGQARHHARCTTPPPTAAWKPFGPFSPPARTSMRRTISARPR